MDSERNKRTETQSFPVSPFSRTTQLQAPERTVQTQPAWREEGTYHHERDEKELEEERMDKFYTLVEKIKTMKESWRHSGENKRVKPVLGPVWQPAFRLEDFEGVGMEGRGKMSRNNGDDQEMRGDVQLVQVQGNEDGKRDELEHECENEQQKDCEEMNWHEVQNNDGIDLNLSL